MNYNLYFEMENKIIYLQNDIKLINLKEDDGKMFLEGYACHFDKANLNSQIVNAKSFNTYFDLLKKNAISKAIMNWEHNLDKQIGAIDTITTDEDGLFIEAHLNTEIPFVADWLVPNIKANDLTGLSTEGYVYGGLNGIIMNEDGSYYVKDMILTAVALTNNPADVEARFSLANAVNEWNLENAVKKSKWYFL